MFTMDDKKYIPGSLFWAKIGRHPFWPCMVSYDPIEGLYAKTRKVKSRNVWTYHVQYFGEDPLHGWTMPGLILPFEGLTQYNEYKWMLIKSTSSAKMKSLVRIKYGVARSAYKSWYKAVLEAETALTYDYAERYENFVFKYEFNFKKKHVKRNVKNPACKNGYTSKRHRSKKRSSKAVKPRRIASDCDENLCSFCEKGNVDLACTGDCFQYYHKACLGMICNPSNFKCLDCEHGLSACFICKTPDNSVIKCSKCTYHYHRDCMKTYKCSIVEKEICSYHGCSTCCNRNPRNVSSKSALVRCFRCPIAFHDSENCIPVGSVKLTPSLIICPVHFLGKRKVSLQSQYSLHYCIVCSKGGNLICCEFCPNTYHSECLSQDVPEGEFLCEDCTNSHYLYVDMLVWCKVGIYRLWPAKIVSENELPLNVENLVKTDGEFPVQYYGTHEYHWTHRGRVIPYAEHHKKFSLLNHSYKNTPIEMHFKSSVKEAADDYDKYVLLKQKNSSNKPEPFKYIKVNHAVYPATISTMDANSVSPCFCTNTMKDPCGKDSLCINRSVLMECLPDICPAGNLCQNQQFQKRQHAPVKVIKTLNCGWGLISQNFISQGDFIIEYVGEVITHKEYQKRADQMQRDNVKNYYFLYLDSRRMIDAGPRGNYSRFINHSCNPNCQMNKWSVNGDLRIGIFALCDIQPGTELTFNYQSDSIQFEQKCFCGSEGCQGFIGRNGIKHKKKKLK